MIHCIKESVNIETVFIYLFSMWCDSGAGVFFNMPQYPSLVIPRVVAILGIISAIITIKDKRFKWITKTWWHHDQSNAIIR